MLVTTYFNMINKSLIFAALLLLNACSLGKLNSNENESKDLVGNTNKKEDKKEDRKEDKKEDKKEDRKEDKKEDKKEDRKEDRKEDEKEDRKEDKNNKNLNELIGKWIFGIYGFDKKERISTALDVSFTKDEVTFTKYCEFENAKTINSSTTFKYVIIDKKIELKERLYSSSMDNSCQLDFKGSTLNYEIKDSKLVLYYSEDTYPGLGIGRSMFGEFLRNKN
jgi:hypothetical protein